MPSPVPPNASPVITDNELLLLYVENPLLIRGEKGFRKILDDPSKRFHQCRVIVTDLGHRWKRLFPYVKLDNLDLRELAENGNPVFCEKYNTLLQQMFTQEKIADYIVSRADSSVIVLILVDGLSYFDCFHIAGVRPCLVPGPSTTENGFKNIVQSGRIVSELWERGYKRRYGFSHWGRTWKSGQGRTALSDAIFYGFSHTAMHEIEEFGNVLEILSKEDLDKSFIQILIEGYDGLAHQNHDRPPVKAIVNRFFRKYLPSLRRLFCSRDLSYRLFLTADHGIWWKKEAGEPPDYKMIEIYASRAGQKRKARRLRGRQLRSEFIVWERNGRTESLLKYPFVLRKYRKNEWGFHGGVSLYESVVPFVEEVRGVDQNRTRT